VNWRADHDRARFLLKYITRDEVDLLGKGNGGLIEVNETVKKYEEQSPLYGFINYRRRKVVLKYVPEGTSRLLQGMSSEKRSNALRDGQQF
jgi:hypothetical protein